MSTKIQALIACSVSQSVIHCTVCTFNTIGTQAFDGESFNPLIHMHAANGTVKSSSDYMHEGLTPSLPAITDCVSEVFVTSMAKNSRHAKNMQDTK